MELKRHHSLFKDVIIFTPQIYTDNRGYFLESYNNSLQETLNISFPQENHSRSKKYVFRGFHFQWSNPLSKLLRVVSGRGIGIILDIRKSSPTYKQHALIELNDTTHETLFTPAGFAQGFLSLEDNTHLCYKCSSLRNASCEGVINPFDPELKINFGIEKENIILSEKDKTSDLFEIYDKNPKFI